jgi:ABC-type branched-subunit amino acid transport system ATPase component/branched-subunit amino acid ABC-type transport system permease component
MLPFIISGLTAGSVYALAGVGLVLTYKTSGLFNFGHGALATISAFLFYTLHVQHGWPWPLAAAVCIVVAGPLLGIALERMARAVGQTSLATRVVSTVGVLLVVQGGAEIIYGNDETRTVPEYLPTRVFQVLGTAVTIDRIIVFAVGILATVALYVYFRVSRTGVAMRAVVDDPALLDVAGTSPVRVRRWAWVIGATLASASGLLLVPYVTLDATNLTFLVVAAYGAAALGSFTSVPGTYAGGLIIGVAAALCSKYFTSGLLSGLSTSLPFVALFIVLLVSRRGRLAEKARIAPRSDGGWVTPWPIQVGAGLIVLVVLLFVPSFAGFYLPDYSGFLAMTILFLSLGLLVRTAGQVSLCHVSFMAIGVCGFAQLAANHNWPWLPALLVGALFTVPIGALLAIPAIRLSGLYLALATFGFGILLQYMFYSQNYMFGSVGAGVPVRMPIAPSLGLTGSDSSYYYLCLVFALIVVGLIVAITHSRLGRLLRALADSPTGLATSGASINVTLVLVFCVSAFIAGIAGILQAGAVGQAGGQSYLPITSLVYFTLIMINVGGAPWYALVAAAGTVIIPSYLTSTDTNYWLQVLFGVTAIAYAMTPARLRGTPPAVRALLDRVPRPNVLGRFGRRRGARPLSPSSASGRSGMLSVQGVTVAFGGLVAVDGVSLEAPTGRITGLIGPNGAGKTTLFNACSGLNRPNRGVVLLDGATMSRRSPAHRARRGLGRTFQQMELYDSLTVRENVELGHEASYAGSNIFQHLVSRPGTSRRVAASAEDALRLCDLQELSDRAVGSLSTGQRRLVELARCLAGPYHILLLDEPSSGLDRAETARFGEVLEQVVGERGVGILLVEHDVALVTAVCSYIYVLDFGKLIFEGPAAEALASPIVQAAYLGTEDVAASEAHQLMVEGDHAV